MPMRFVAEMFCDRVAASKVYRGAEYKSSDPLDYFERGRDRRVIHPKTSAQLHFLLKMLAQKGEAATFSYLRKRLRRQRR